MLNYFLYYRLLRNTEVNTLQTRECSSCVTPPLRFYSWQKCRTVSNWSLSLELKLTQIYWKVYWDTQILFCVISHIDRYQNSDFRVDDICCWLSMSQLWFQQAPLQHSLTNSIAIIHRQWLWCRCKLGQLVSQNTMDKNRGQMRLA